MAINYGSRATFVEDTSDLDALITDAEQRHGLPAGLYRSLIVNGEKSGASAVSPKGARGVAQLMPGTARELGVDDPFDPVQGLDGGARYLRQQLDRFGDPKLAVAAYNAGPGAVEKHGGVPPYRETQSYVQRVMGAGAELLGAGPAVAAEPINYGDRAAFDSAGQPERPAMIDYGGKADFRPPGYTGPVFKNRDPLTLQSILRHPREGLAEAGERLGVAARDSLMRGTILGTVSGAAARGLGRLLDQNQDPAATAAGLIPRHEAQTLRAQREEAFRAENNGGKNLLEKGLDLAGGFAGAIPTPESLISLPLRGLGIAGRPIVSGIVRKGTEQAIINAASDPLIQGVNIARGVQDGGYDPMRTAANAGFGAAFGGAFGAAGGVVDHVRAGRAVKGAAPSINYGERATFDEPADAPRAPDAADVTGDFTASTDRFGPAATAKPPASNRIPEGATLDTFDPAAQGLPDGYYVDATGKGRSFVNFGGSGRASDAGAPSPRSPAGDVGGSASAPGAGGVPSFRPGKSAPAFTPRGEELGFTYGVADLADLTPSHTGDLTPNPRYPGELQPRDRTRAASDAQVTTLARDLRPELLGESPSVAEGAPIIGPDGVVESGNARTIALGRLYAAGDPKAAEYRGWLKSQGYDVDGLAQPVLVRRRDTNLTPEQRVEFARAANERSTAAMSPSEQARADADKLTPDLLDGYTGGGLDTQNNAPFVAQALSRIASPAELNLLTEGGGRVSAEGSRRIRAAMTQRAYGDTDLVARLYEDARPELGGLGRAVQDAAPAWAGMRAAIDAGRVPRELDATAPLTEALALVRQAREGRVNLSDVFSTRDAFRPRDPRVQDFARLFYSDDAFSRVRSGQAIARDLESYAAEARRSESGALFGEDPRTLSRAVLDGLIRRARGEEAKAPAAAAVLGARGEHDPASTVARYGGRIEGEGVGGPLIRGLEGRFSEAVDVLRSLRGGDVVGALHHREVGPIDLIWGDERGGLAHILAKPDGEAIVRDLPATLERSSVVPGGRNRVFLEDPQTRTVVALDYLGAEKRWLLTAYRKGEGQSGGGRIDSATREGPAVAAPKGSPGQLADGNIARPGAVENAPEAGDNRGLSRPGEPLGMLRGPRDAPVNDSGVRLGMQRPLDTVDTSAAGEPFPALRSRGDSWRLPSEGLGPIRPVPAGGKTGPLGMAPGGAIPSQGRPAASGVPRPIDLSGYGDVIDRAAGRSKGLRDAPRPGAVPRQAGGREKLPAGARRVEDMAARLRKALNLTHRQGRLTLKGRAVGEYHPETGVIRTKQMQELNVLAHEGGHALEFQNIPALNSALKTYAGELRPLAYEGARPGTEREEGFAEFFRWYVTNPEVARREAPRFYGAFEGAMAKGAPGILAELQAIQRAYQSYLKTASADVLRGAVVRTPRSPTKAFMRAMKDDGVLNTAARMADKAYTAFVDDLHPLSRATRELQELYAANTGRKLDLNVAKNPYALARLSRDAYGMGHMDILHGVRAYGGVDPDSPALSDALALALGDKFLKWDEEAVDEFGAYLIARRMVHEYDRYAEGKLDRPPDAFSKEAHEQAIKDFEAANPKWSDAARMVYDWNQALWKLERDAGFISEATYQAGLTEHPDYVPLMRDVSDKARAGGRPVGGDAQFAGGAKRFRGSDRDFINPIESMMTRAYRLRALIARNDAFKALDDLGQLAGRDGGAIVERLPATEMRAINVDAMEALESAARSAGLSKRDLTTLLDEAETMLGGDTGATLYRAGEINPRGEPIVFVWRDGTKIPLRLPDGEFGRDMYTALTGMTQPMKSLLVDLAAAPTQTLRYGITASPEFFFSNLIRDQISTWINTDVGFKPFVSSARGMVDEVGQTDFARRYSHFGGTIGGANVAAARDGRINKDIQAARKKGYAIRRFGGFNAFSAFTEISETGTRMGVGRLAFKQAKKQGLSDHDAMLEAAYAARDYLDFGRHGSKMLVARRVFTFMNAAIQGLDKTLRVSTAGGNLGRLLAPLGKGAPQSAAEAKAFAHAYKAWAKISAIGVFGLALRALYQDDPEYEEISDYLRNTHWMAKLGGEWIAIPKPFELAALSNVFERAFEAEAKNDPTAWNRLIEGLGEVVVPPHEIPALAVPYQVGANRDGNGRQIVPEHLKGAVDPHLQFNSYTSEFGKALGKTFNVSPAVVDHVVTGFGGSLGRYFLQGTDWLAARAGGAPASDAGLEDAFLTRRFVRDVTRSSTSQKQFWDLVSRDGGEFTRKEGTFRQLLNEGRQDEAQAYLAKLKPPEREFVVISVFGTANDKRQHPVLRAKESSQVIGDLRRDISSGDIRGPQNTTITLTSSQRSQVDDALAYLQMAEMRNALIAAGVKGWEQKRPIPRAEALARIYEASPPVVAVMNMRMGVAQVIPPSLADDVEALWAERRGAVGEVATSPALAAEMDAKRFKGRAGAMRYLRTDPSALPSLSNTGGP